MDSRKTVLGSVGGFITAWDIAMQVCHYAGQKIADDITEETKNAIEDFYDNYDPKYYLRTYNFKNNSYKRYYKPNKYSVVGGVILSPDDMEVYINGRHRLNPELPFNSSYAGYHGISSGFEIIKHRDIGEAEINIPSNINLNVSTHMSPPPLERIVDKKRSIEKNIDKYIEGGTSRMQEALQKMFEKMVNGKG